jgi:hypothetical protein
MSVDNRMKKVLWIYESVMFLDILVMTISLVFVVMMIVNIRTGFQPPFDPYEALIISSIVFVASIIILILIIVLHYRTLYNEPPSRFTKLYATGTRVKKRCTICHKHPVSKGYHLKHVHQLENVKKGDYFEDCGCELCQNLSGWIEDVYHLMDRDK